MGGLPEPPPPRSRRSKKSPVWIGLSKSCAVIGYPRGHDRAIDLARSGLPEGGGTLASSFCICVFKHAEKEELGQYSAILTSCLGNNPNIFLFIHVARVGYSLNFLTGMCLQFLQIHTRFQTIICDFPYSISFPTLIEKFPLLSQKATIVTLFDSSRQTTLYSSAHDQNL